MRTKTNRQLEGLDLAKIREKAASGQGLSLREAALALFGGQLSVHRYFHPNRARIPAGRYVVGLRLITKPVSTR